MWAWTVLLVLGACIPFGAQGMPTKKYSCPPNFIRHGSSCYYFSTNMASWRESHYACKDLNSELAILEKGWEDKNMRTYLNKPELARLERWIGGIYNWEIKRWVWGANGGNPLKYQGFSQMSRNRELRWNCIIMDPKMNYKWSGRLCSDTKHFICEVPLKSLKTPQPHAALPQKSNNNRDPNKVKKQRNPAKKPRDPNKKQRNKDPNRRGPRRQGWRQRQRLRQQQRANAKLQPAHSTPVYETQTTRQTQDLPQIQTTSHPQYQPQPGPYPPQSGYHHNWPGQHRYRYLQLQPELIPYREEVLI